MVRVQCRPLPRAVRPPMTRLLNLLTLLLPLLALGALPAHAQEKGSITGRVTDKKTGHALPFASVNVVEAKRGVLTDSEGQFVLSGLLPGTYDVRAQFLGYKADSRPGGVEIKFKEGGAAFPAGLTSSSGRYGGRALQVVVGGPDPALGRLLRLVGLPGTVSSLLDISGSGFETRFQDLFANRPDPITS